MTQLNNLLDEVTFNYGWVSNTKLKLSLNNKEYEVSCVFQSQKSQSISEEQKQSLASFLNKQSEYEKKANALLNGYITAENISNDEKIKPKTLLFKRDGSFAILADCSWDIENGIAIILSPQQSIGIQDIFL
ncbi:hypothetical protein [Volucribacter amazonae]|uniref:Uncharacterized protein n=1 Tax=Volucribacter amazonae TaxID=256731 RepID=A0A9X4PR27_9PAST|nr:hypothetical protein [Volucribacter amazonae]MDG6896063.1 hypothetical protein [Volucribacter amazonae]